jgi:hypothetical protein
MNTREINPTDVQSDEIVEEAAKVVSNMLNPSASKTKTVKGAPEWAIIPPGFSPPQGARVCFMKFRAEWTDTPEKGDRQCIIWSLSLMDERNALARARGDVLRTLDEMAKQTVRVVDGNMVDWTGKLREGDLDMWWNDIGPRCRTLIQRHYNQTHNLTAAEQEDFFENCIAVLVRD